MSPGNELILSKAQVRRFLLAHQGLWPPYAGVGKAGILDYVRRVGCIQFDPLNIVGRNPDLVLQSRIADYDPAMLEELLYEERKLVDGWDKNMSIYGIGDWPSFRRRRESARRGYGDPSRPAARVLPQVRQAIAERGPLSSIDLDLDQTVDWSWAPTRLARAALESMYWWGELVIHHKVNTRKVYDLARRHVPEELLSGPDPNETEAQYHDWYVLRRIGGIGLLWNRSGDAWLGMRSIKSKDRSAALARLIEQGKVTEVRVEGIKWPLYMRSEDGPALDRALSAEPPLPRATILAPLDNMLWDRRLVEDLFGFLYVWEVYKPVAERRYGYYVLPVLYGDRIVARFEPGRDKQRSLLTVKNWWWEPEVRTTEGMLSELRACFARFQSYLGVDALRVEPEAAAREDLGWLVGE